MSEKGGINLTGNIRLQIQIRQRQLHIPQPKSAEIFHSTEDRVDHNNIIIPDTLKMEKSETKYWLIQINMSHVSINMVNVYIAYSQATGDTDPQGVLYFDLAENIMDKN